MDVMYSMYFVFSYFICPVYCSIDTNACQYVRIKKLLYHNTTILTVCCTFHMHGSLLTKMWLMSEFLNLSKLQLKILSSYNYDELWLVYLDINRY